MSHLTFGRKREVSFTNVFILWVVYNVVIAFLQVKRIYLLNVSGFEGQCQVISGVL